MMWVSQVLGQAEPLIRRLEGPMRVKVLAALAGLIILGAALIALVWMGARMTRRYMRAEPFMGRQRPDPGPAPDDWALGKELADRESGRDKTA